MTEDLTHQTLMLQALFADLADACVTIEVLARQMGLTHRQISNAARGLIVRGFVDRIEAGCFKLTEAGATAAAEGVIITSGPRRPHAKLRSAVRDTLRQRAWTAMRIQRRFTVRDIAMVSASGSERDAVENVSRFFRVLARAGYLRVVGREPGTAPGSNGFVRYQLVRNTGPRVPVHSEKRGAIHDFNTEEDVACRPS